MKSNQIYEEEKEEGCWNEIYDEDRDVMKEKERREGWRGKSLHVKRHSDRHTHLARCLLRYTTQYYKDCLNSGDRF